MLQRPTEPAALPPRPAWRWRFDKTCFDEASLMLTIDGKPVELERRPLDLLALLLAPRRRGRHQGRNPGIHLARPRRHRGFADQMRGPAAAGARRYRIQHCAHGARLRLPLRRQGHSRGNRAGTGTAACHRFLCAWRSGAAPTQLAAGGAARYRRLRRRLAWRAAAHPRAQGIQIRARRRGPGGAAAGSHAGPLATRRAGSPAPI